MAAPRQADSMANTAERPTRRLRNGLTTGEVLNLLDDSDLSLSDTSETENFDDSDVDPDYNLSDSSESDRDGEFMNRPQPEAEAELDTESEEDTRLNSEPIRGRKRGRGRPVGRRSLGIGGRGQRRQMEWNRSDDFFGKQINQDNQFENIVNEQSPVDLFKEYIDDNLTEMIARNTNVMYFQRYGRSLDTTQAEICRFVGINIIMGTLRYPRLRMYWAHATAVTSIVQAMSRERYFKLRANLKVTNDLDISAEERSKDKLWKVRPLLEQVRQACLHLTRPQTVCVDEQMIPFTGHCGIRQHIRGKPHPTGLKNFVIASSGGSVLDFEVYQGKESLLNDGYPDLPAGALVVLRLLESFSPGTSVYMDRYFTTIPLLEALLMKEMHGTGTITKRSVPAMARNHLLPDRELAKKGRGSCNQIVREDGQIVVVQWYDNKSVLMASTESGVQPVTDCRRWSKPDKAYLNISRPAVVKMYNDKMGGVDLNDRMISFYRINGRTNKWTVRTIFHMIDMSLVNSWVLYREKGSNRIQLLDFRMRVGESLVYTRDTFAVGAELENDGQPPRKRVALPPQEARRNGALHLPRVIDLKNAARCRHPGCKTGKSRVKCTGCNLFFCIRECFENFHK